MGIGIVEFAGLVSRRRKTCKGKDLVRGIEVRKITDLGKDHGSHAVAYAGNRGNRRMQFVHEFFNLGFYFLNLLGKHADKSNGMFEFQRLCGHDTPNGRNGGVSKLNIHEKEVILSEQLKRLSKEKTQLEKELHKLRDEVCKVIMGESQWSQSVLSQLIETKEQDLSDIVKKQEDIEFKLKELAAYLAERKANLSELNNWAERFDIQDTPAKKAMLINAIDRITVFDDKITVKYKFKCDYFRGGTKFDIDNDKAVGEVPSGVFPCLPFVQGMSQPSRERSFLSARRRKIPMRP